MQGRPGAQHSCWGRWRVRPAQVIQGLGGHAEKFKLIKYGESSQSFKPEQDIDQIDTGKFK